MSGERRCFSVFRFDFSPFGRRPLAHLSVLSVRLPSRSRTAATGAATSEGTAHETSATTAAATSKHGTHHHTTHHGVSVVIVGLVILLDNGVPAMGAEQGLSD